MAVWWWTRSRARLGRMTRWPLQPDTLFCSFSVTKGIAAIALHMQAERGLIDYDAPVAKYWPAFGQHGKEPDHRRTGDEPPDGHPQYGATRLGLG